MTQKIVHKLNKDIRKQIAFNYIKDYFSNDVSQLNRISNSISKSALDKINEMYSKEKIDSIESHLEKLNVKNQYFDGLLYGYYVGEVSLQLKIYAENKINIEMHDNDLSPHLKNKNISNKKINYAKLLDFKNNKELPEFERKTKKLSKEIWSRFDLCYELLSKVRTAELLMQHWSKAHEYLPDDMEVEEPNKLSLSERFKLL